MPNNKLLLTIAGLSILINTNEDESYAKALADEVDKDISTILHANAGASVTNSALLCAIDYLDSAKKATKNANTMRNQVKDYLDDAAKAKFKYDEEHKRASELAGEINSLRSHLTRLATEGDSSGVVQTMKSELTAANAELAMIHEKAAKIAAANKALTEKSAAMSDYISGQDKELSRSNSIVGELNATIAKKDEQLTTLATRIETISADNRTVKNENARLNTEMYTMEQTMIKERAITKAVAEELKALRDKVEELEMENEIAQEEIAKLKGSSFSPAAIFDQPLSDELEQESESPEPVLFDYEADTDPQSGNLSGQISLDSILLDNDENKPQLNEITQPSDKLDYDEVVELDAPMIFDGFQVVNDFDLDNNATQPLPTSLIGDDNLTFQYEPAFDDSNLDFKQKELDENLPDLSWTMEI